uniref:26S proteasome regulatory subunit rpn1, putative n=1 Tax=Arundo donax TaxID=35708 RepID=A0A0A9FG65_ARUDO
MQSIPRARGTARLIFCSPYCKRRSSERTAISAPNSSAIAIRAIPRTAGPWCVSPFSRCCEQIPRSF